MSIVLNYYKVLRTWGGLERVLLISMSTKQLYSPSDVARFDVKAG